MKVVWTEMAVRNLTSIHTYVAADSPGRANQLVSRLLARCEQVAAFPQSGRVVPEYRHPEVRELIEGSYRILYRLKESQVDVLGVVHVRQELPWSRLSELG